MRQPVLRKLMIGDIEDISESVGRSCHSSIQFSSCETERGMLGKEMKVEDLGKMVIFLICCSVCLLLTCQSEYWTLSAAAEGPTNKHLVLTAECPVNTSGLIRNSRSIVDRIFTGDGLASPACGSDHYQPIEITIKELLPINLAVYCHWLKQEWFVSLGVVHSKWFYVSICG